MAKKRPWTQCPHNDVSHCPLYHAMHYAGLAGLSCDDGRLDGSKCAVDRGMSYERARAHLDVRRPAIVAHCQFNEDAAEAAAQRRRNMQALGLH
jgi:hypothetical protein